MRLCRTVSSPPGRTLNGCKRRLGKVFDLRAALPKVSGVVPGRESAGQQSNGGEANVGESNGVAPGQTAGKSKPGIAVAQAGRNGAVRGRNRSLKGVKRRKRAFGKKSRMTATGQKKFAGPRFVVIRCKSMWFVALQRDGVQPGPSWSKRIFFIGAGGPAESSGVSGAFFPAFMEGLVSPRWEPAARDPAMRRSARLTVHAEETRVRGRCASASAPTSNPLARKILLH